MPTVAEQLRAAREAHGLTVYEVAEITKIRTDHIRALEEGNYPAFAAPVYVRGSVRAYGQLVRLDVASLLSTLETELSQCQEFADAGSLLGRRRGFLDVLMLQLSKVKWSVALPTLGLVLFFLACYLGYRAWLDFQSRDPLADLGPGLYEPAADRSTDVLPLPPAEP